MLVVVVVVVVVGHPALHLGLRLTGLDLPPGEQKKTASVVVAGADGDGGGGGTACPLPGAPSHRLDLPPGKRGEAFCIVLWWWW